ncbi:uncharacterized protein LOC102167165 [Sus scrofa]|uniref:uncharacterized protein LOC102167165 n=1 Tax=Sus scrofa TaxID=9823 RepID=UPI000A2B6079|nr:uncharacterized protein LOC102167165 [Sus scrofa]
MSAAAGCRQSRCRPGRRWLQSAAIILCSLRAAAMVWGSGGGSIFTAAPPARGRPRARVSGASPSPLPPPSLLSFAARISLEFYSLPHVTHRVKLHLRRVTHQHSASPSRPGHRQQQPPPTEDSQPGSQPAPPSAECAAAAHGNSRARPGGARAAPPSALEAELAEDLRVPSGAAEGFRGMREGEAWIMVGPLKHCLLVGPGFNMATLSAISVSVPYNLKEMKTSLKLYDLPMS